MAQVIFKKGNLASLATSGRDANTLYFAEDKGVLFLGDTRFSDVILATSEPQLADVLPNRLYVFNNKIYFRGTKPLSTGSGTQEAVVCVDAGNSAEIEALKALVGTLPEDTEAEDIVGYVDEQIEDLSDDLTAKINAKVASVTAADKSIEVGGTGTAPTLKVNVHTASGTDAANALQLKDGGLYVPTPAAADTYEIAKAEDSGTYAAVYQLLKKTNGQGTGVKVGVDINIPKDMVVQSGSVVTVSETDKGKDGNPANAGTYIKLVLQNVTDPLFIDVGSLIEYVTGGTAADGMITVAVDSTTHVATATLNDGKVTLAKLDTATQTKINQAHTHENKELLDTYTQTEDDLADAVEKAHEHDNATELDKIASGDKAKWDAAATAAGTAVQGIQVNGTDVAADSSKKVNITAATGTANGQVKIAGQDVDVKGLASAAYKTEEYFIGTDDDDKDDDTIKGAKAYADDAATTAKNAALAALSWQTF